MFKKLSVLLLGILIGCSSVRLSDHWYSQGPATKTSLATKEMQESIVYFSGCSATVIAIKNGKSYVATASHCIDFAYIKHHITWLNKTDGDPEKFNITHMWNNSIKDIAFLEIDGILPVYSMLLADKPLDGGTDIIIGWVSGKETITIGYAIPGQSGGGVFDSEGGLWGIVSTTGTGVSIYPALKQLNLLWILNK